MAALHLGIPAVLGTRAKHRYASAGFRTKNAVAVLGEFPSFLPKEVENIKDPFARSLAQRIERVPVQQVGFSEGCIMSSCVKPANQCEATPVVLLHCFDSSCLEWRRTLPLLEEAGLETWAVDVLGWGFSDLETRPPCSAEAKTNHLYELWRAHIKRPMILVGPSLGASVAIDFAVKFPEAVDRLILIDASVYADGVGILMELPNTIAYAGVSLLKSIPLRFYANLIAFHNIPLSTCLDWTNVGRLHCLLPWWEDATVNYMLSGGYSIGNKIKLVKQKTLIIWGERDRIVCKKVATQLHQEMQNASVRMVPESGHLPHVEKPESVARLISEFARSDSGVRRTLVLGLD